jgi:hypothetical protein
MEVFLGFTMWFYLCFALYHSLGIRTLEGPRNLECQSIKKKITKTTQEEKGFVSTLENIDKENDHSNIVGSSRSCTNYVYCKYNHNFLTCIIIVNVEWSFNRLPRHCYAMQQNMCDYAFK